MKNIKQLKKEIEELYFKIRNETLLTSQGEQDIRLMIIKQAKLQTLQEVCGEINLKINYYNMPLKERLKLKLDFENGEAGHKIVILLKLLKKFQGDEK